LTRRSFVEKLTEAETFASTTFFVVDNAESGDWSGLGKEFF
jgi:hypothetical protein